MTSFTIPVEEDKSTGDLYITIPPEILKDLDWKENDTIVWNQLTDTQFSLTKTK